MQMVMTLLRMCFRKRTITIIWSASGLTLIKLDEFHFYLLNDDD